MFSPLPIPACVLLDTRAQHHLRQCSRTLVISISIVRISQIWCHDIFMQYLVTLHSIPATCATAECMKPNLSS